ncbi:AMP-binding protein [Rugosimonospora africana]|uniref:Long-chain acyl-CoA synthetase n=1 Tax=Rugosimonospora africana TaxID=556532 RepID=A0A8J3QNK5_9ACTN|nr:AMP-binding protein [Rugosimonospora africana]GIH12306.1 long-chain acyl-CoA synthetase [Rugosimonospora africana]
MHEPRNVAETVRQAARTTPDKAALIWQDQTVTWAELDGRIDELAAGLRALDLPEDNGHPARVAIALPNVPRFVESYFAVLRAGLIAVPVNPGYTGRELRHILADSGAAVLFATPEVLASVDLVADGLPLRHRYAPDAAPPSVPGGAQPEPGHGGGEHPPRFPDQVSESQAGGEDLAVLLYTSGTEGNPKGAMLSHRALLANHAQLAQVEPQPLAADDMILLALPLFHSYGLNAGLGALAYHGATGVLLERFDPVESLRLVAEHQVSIVIGVPAMFVAWSLLPEFGEAFASVRLTVSGAAPLHPVAGTRFLNATGHPVFEGYGLTEAAPVLTSALAAPVPKPGSIGRAIPGVTLKLVAASGDEIDITDDDFDDDAPGSPGTDPGEIVARGANLFSGYWPDGRDGPDAEGWWATGDVAYADADGDLFLVDRKRELILVSGFNVYPYEVEQVLMAHPAVREAAVLGIPHPYSGQTVKAFVVISAMVGTEELLAHCERNLARFKCPTAIEFVPSLPHSATGRVRKAKLRDQG